MPFVTDIVKKINMMRSAEISVKEQVFLFRPVHVNLSCFDAEQVANLLIFPYNTADCISVGGR